MLLVLMAQNQTERGWSGFCLVSMFILVMTIVGMRLSDVGINRSTARL